MPLVEKKILLVEDDPKLAIMARHWLMAGFREIENRETSKSEAQIELFSMESIKLREVEATICIAAGARNRACTAGVDQQVAFVIGTTMDDGFGSTMQAGDIQRSLV